MGDGRWAMGDGRWAMGDGRYGWRIVDKRLTGRHMAVCTIDHRPSTIDHRPSTIDSSGGALDVAA